MQNMWKNFASPSRTTSPSPASSSSLESSPATTSLSASSSLLPGNSDKVLRSLDQLKSTLSALSLEVNFELSMLQSPNLHAISSQCQQSLAQLSQVRSLIVEQVKNKELNSTSPSYSPLLFSPADAEKSPNQRNRRNTLDSPAALKNSSYLSPPYSFIQDGNNTADTRSADGDDLSGMSGDDDDFSNWQQQQMTKQSNSRNVAETKVLLEAEERESQAARSPSPFTPAIDAQKVKIRWAEAMKQGSWFWRISHKFGLLGKVVNASLRRRRVFISLSPNFGSLSVGPNEQQLQDFGSKRRKTKMLPLDRVTLFEYGSRSPAYRLVEETHSKVDNPAHLCMSLVSGKVAIDLVALNDDDIENWVLGLNCLTPPFNGRQFFTADEFKATKTILKEEYFRC